MGQRDSQKPLLIFLSHASEDKPKVRNLWKRLTADGFDPWLDEKRLLPGQKWGLEIDKAMHASDVILLCFSELAVSKSGYIQREYKRAMDISLEKPEGAIFVIPVRLDSCEVPNFIHEVQWMDYPEDYERLLISLQIRTGGSTKMEKPEPKNEPAKQKPASSAKPGGTVFNIQGGIHIGRDFVNRDQYNYITNTETINNISTPSEFVSELQKLKAEIETLKSQSNVEPTVARRLTAVEGDIEDAISEAASERPVAEHIKSTLEGAKETMDKLNGSIASATKLGATLGTLGTIALTIWKAFGG